MRNFLFYPFICLILLFSFTPLSWSAQMAIVKSEYAIIYADKELSVPIGKVNQGETLLVGEGQKSLRKILPVIVNGKILYINNSDILINEANFSRKNSEADQEMILRFNENDGKLFEEIFPLNLYIGYGLKFLNENWKELQTVTNGESSDFNFGHLFEFKLRSNVIKNLSFDYGFRLTYARSAHLLFYALAPEIGSTWSYYYYENMIFSLKSTFQYTPLTTANIYGRSFEGTSYGFSLGPMVTFQQKIYFSYSVGISFDYLQTLNLTYDVGNQSLNNFTLNGVNLYFALVHFF